MTLIFAAPPPVTLAIAGTDARFPVRRILCVGRNYEAHAREMGNDPSREPPFFFMKPADTIVEDGATIDYPPGTEDLHHEIELVVAIGTEGFAIKEVRCPRSCLRLCGRHRSHEARRAEPRQEECPSMGLVERFRPFGALVARSIRRAPSDHISKGRIHIAVNGVVKQDQDVADLIWSIPEIIAYASKDMRLMPGDLIYTGTPSGVASLKRGDTVEGGVEGVGSLHLTIA